MQKKKVKKRNSLKKTTKRGGITKAKHQILTIFQGIQCYLNEHEINLILDQNRNMRG